MGTENDEVVLTAIRCITEVFTKEPYLVIKSYENGFDFHFLVQAVKDADPEMALAGIEFWQRFIMIDSIIFKDDFKRKLFDQYDSI